MTDNQQSTPNTSTVTTPAEREIHIERVFNAPRERLFAAFTDPELTSQWWGPRGTTTVVVEMDVRPGGIWRFVSKDSDGSEFGFRGVYREVAPPERLVQSFVFGGMPGYISLETAIFEDLGDGRTKITSDVIFYTNEERDGMLSAGMEKGMNESFERLDELLAT